MIFNVIINCASIFLKPEYQRYHPLGLPTSRAQNCSLAPIGSGRLFYVFYGKSERAGAYYRNRKWEAKDFEKVCHPASRASFYLLLDRGGEKEALPDLRQSFEVAASRTSGLVNLVSSHQTGFLCATIYLYVHNRTRCTKQTAIRPGFNAVS